MSGAAVRMSGADLLALAREALARAGEAEAEVSLRSTARGFARFAIGSLSQHMDVLEPSAVVRVAHGTRVAEASTTLLHLDGLVAALRAASSAARLVPPSEGFPGFAEAGPDGPRPPRFVTATAEATAETRTALLAPVLQEIAAAGLVSAGALETSTTSLAVATTRGCARQHDGTAASFKVWALETPGAGGAAGYGGQLHRNLTALDLAGQTEHAIRIARASHDPIAIEAGDYDVVMEPAAVAELVEWLGAIAFGAPEVEQGTSPVAGRRAQPVTGVAITLREDPLDDGDAAITAPFDREGVWRRRVDLVVRGVAREILYDRTYAQRMGATSTGSALVGGGTAVGPSALAMTPGKAAGVDALIGGVKRGLYVSRLHYVNGLLETRRAVMTGLTRDGCFLVEGGRITRPVGNLRFTDAFLEMLARADGMTRARTAVPTWWSEAGATLVPAVRFRQVRFTGKSQVAPALE